MSCHAGKLAKSHPEGANGNCVACHMPKRDAKDGGHTVFTDHRISRRPEQKQEEQSASTDELVAWREPAPAVRGRNLALAYVDAGFENQAPAMVMRGYSLLAEVVKQLPDDSAVLTALGKSLLAMNRPLEAVKLFERVLELGPDSAVNEGYAGTAWMQAGDMRKAELHLERAVAMDPLLFPTVEALVQVYRQQGEMDKVSALAERVQQAMGSAAPPESASPQR